MTNGITLVHQLVEANGKTIKENNLCMLHNIPIGTLVEVNSDETQSHGVRAFVASHGRDCDGTVLYSLCLDRNHCDDQLPNDQYAEVKRRMYHNGGWSEESLIVITKDWKNKDYTPEWLIQSMDKNHFLPVYDKRTLFSIPGHGTLTADDLRVLAAEMDRRTQQAAIIDNSIVKENNT